VKLTVITNETGELVALVHAHLSEHDRERSYKDGPHATLRPLPGQKFHEIELPAGSEKLAPHEIRRMALEHSQRSK